MSPSVSARDTGARTTTPPFCSPDDPGGVRILKRIATRHEDGALIVEGDTPRALDSRWLGPVQYSEVRGWWAPLVQIR